MFQDNADAQHAPTPTRLQTARADGDVTVSRSLSGAIQLMGMLLVIWLFLGYLGSSLKSFTRTVWGHSEISASEYQVDQLAASLAPVGWAMLPVLAVGFVFTVLSVVGQTGPMWLPQRVGLDPTRISPRQWLQRVFSPSHLLASLMALPKLIIVGSAAAFAGYLNWKEIMTMGGYAIEPMMERLVGLLLKIGFQTALILFVFGLIDYALRWTARQRRLRMSDEQLRQEQRMQSGNPQTSERRRRLHRELSLHSLSSESESTQGH